jgi:hypothetical protein
MCMYMCICVYVYVFYTNIYYTTIHSTCQVHSDPLQGHWSGGQTLVDFVQWCKEVLCTVYCILYTV